MRIAALALALSATVSGRVVDLATGKPVAGASLTARTTGAPAAAPPLAKGLSSSRGAFTLSLPENSTCDLAADATGYAETILHGVSPGTEKLLVRLLPAVAEAAAQDLEVTAEHPRVDQSPTISSHSMGADAVDETPGSMEDVARAISLKPGVVPLSEFAPIVSIRGGDVYQTYFFLDDVLVYNPFQPVGGGTIFNPDLVAQTDLYTGGQLASFPEALAGIISIRYKDPRTDRVHLTAEVSAISLNLRAEGGSSKSGGISQVLPDGWLVSARRSDYEPLLAAAKPILGSQDIAAPSFIDLFAKATWRLSPVDDLAANAMFVQNALSNLVFDQSASNNDTLFYNDQQYLGWARWTRVLGDATLVKTTVSHVSDILRANATGTDPLAVNVNSLLDSVRTDFTYAPERGSNWDTGVYLNRADFQLVGRVPDFRQLEPDVAIGGNPNLPLVNLIPERVFYDFSAYAQYKHTIADVLTVQPGVRVTWNDASDETVVGPRLNAAWKLDEHQVLKAAWGIYDQPPFNVIYLDPQFGNPKLKSERAIHYVAGYEGQLSDWLLKVEVFYKDIWNQIVPQDFSGVNLQNPSPGDIAKLQKPFLNAGHSWAAGAELMLQRDLSSKLRLELDYSLLKVLTTNPLIDNPGERTFAPYRTSATPPTSSPTGAPTTTGPSPPPPAWAAANPTPPSSPSRANPTPAAPAPPATSGSPTNSPPTTAPAIPSTRGWISGLSASGA